MQQENIYTLPTEHAAIVTKHNTELGSLGLALLQMVNLDRFGHKPHETCSLPDGHKVHRIAGISDICGKFRREARLQKRTHLYFLGNSTNCLLFIIDVYQCTIRPFSARLV